MLFAAAAALTAVPAMAEVKASSASGFVSENQTVVPVTPARAYQALGQIGSWWRSDHTYSGKAANLRLDARAGGCFCETWSGGTVEHGRVIYARPGQQLRIAGALGALQGEAVVGTLTWSLKAAGGGTEITQRYVVGGYVAGGADKYAGPVDQVLAQQLASFVRSVAK
jgi:uncharacterized protein YndB with AHSA1/START domain